MQTAPCQIGATQSVSAVLCRLYFRQWFWAVVFILSCVPSLTVEVQDGPSSFEKTLGLRDIDNIIQCFKSSSELEIFSLVILQRLAIREGQNGGPTSSRRIAPSVGYLTFPSVIMESSFGNGWVNLSVKLMSVIWSRTSGRHLTV